MQSPLGPLTAVLLALTLALGGCGLETAGTAAAVGTAKKTELEQAQAQRQRLEQDLARANEQLQQRQGSAEDAAR